MVRLKVFYVNDLSRPKTGTYIIEDKMAGGGKGIVTPGLNLIIQGILVALAGGLVAQVLARWLNLPDILFFLVAGMVLGPQGLNAFHFAPTSGVSGFVFTVGTLAMLYEGGRSLDLALLAKIWRGVLILSTLGVLVTAAVMAVAIHSLLGGSWILAWLMAAVVSSTDPATIIPLFRQIRLRPRLAKLVEAESAFNDAVSSAFSLLLLGVVDSGQAHFGHAAGQFVLLLVGGLVVGAVASYGLNTLLTQRRYQHIVLDSLEHPAIVSLVIMLVSYMVATWVGASGFMAAFTAGIVSGNRHTFGHAMSDEQGLAHENYLFTNATLIRMLLFILLGSQINFTDVFRILLPGLLTIGVFIFISRPLTVMVCLSLDRRGHWTLNDMAFVSWVRETGVMPVALAGILAATRVPGAHTLSALVFMAVLLTILIQGATTGWWVQRLGLSQ